MDVATNSSSSVVPGSALDYDAHGNLQSGSLTTAASDRTYTGERQSPASGLLRFGARDYDPATGTFIQPDTIVPQPGDTLSFSRYTYANNNALRYVDPSGYCPICIGVAALLVAGYEILTAPDTANAPSLDVNPSQLPPSEVPIQTHVVNIAINSVFAYAGVSEAKATWDLFRLQQTMGQQEGLQEMTTELTGRMMQWHPGGGHHGLDPYWKISTGETGTIRVGPQFCDPAGGDQ